MCLHYLGKFEVSDWTVNAIIKCIFKWLTEWQQTITWLAVIISQKSHTCHLTSSLLQRVVKMSAPARTQARRRPCHSTLTDFRWFFWSHNDYLSRHAVAWIHCFKRPNYDFCISQGSVATVLRLGGQNYGHLCHISSRCCTPKIIKVGQCFPELFTK